MGLNPFSSLPPPDSSSEEIVQAKAGLDEAVEKAYNLYQGLIFGTPYWYDDGRITKLEEQRLSPSQINNLLMLIRSDTEPNKVNDRVTGVYLTRLIQDSYDAVNNDFVLTTEDTNIDHIGIYLRGEVNNKLRLRIEGSVGCHCVAGAIHTEIMILGSTGDGCGAQAEHTILTAQDEETYYVFKDYVSRKNGNTIRLVNSEGEILKEERLKRTILSLNSRF